jgi:hypothetical protein
MLPSICGIRFAHGDSRPPHVRFSLLLVVYAAREPLVAACVS